MIEGGCVIFCGSRDWADPDPVRAALRRVAERWPGATVLHGGSRGLDQMADALASSMGIRTQAEMADWKGKGRPAGPARNRRMLKLKPLAVIAFKDDFDETLARDGTENTVKIAKAAGVAIYFFSHAAGWRIV